MAHKRVSLSLTPDVHDALNDVSHLLGVSRSSLVNELLSELLPTMSGLLHHLHDGDSSEAAMRLRGASASVIRDKLNVLRDAMQDLDPDSFELVPCADRPAGCSCDYSSGLRVPPRGGCLVHGSGED